MKSMFKSTLLLGLTTAMAVSSAMGALTFTNGDLILGFQATGGTGVQDNVFFNLGSGVDLRDGNTTGILGNISTTLSSFYGANWYDRTDLYFGVIANLDARAASGVGAGPDVDGDAPRTFYLSRAAATPGSASLLPASTYNSSALGTAGTTLSGLEGILPSAAVVAQPDGSGVLNQTASPVEWNNSWTAKNPTPGAAFTTFTGGIQQNFGEASAFTYVDMHRIVSTNTGTNLVPGVIGGSQYITTIAIGENGDISVIPEPSAALLGSLGALALFRRRRA